MSGPCPAHLHGFFRSSASWRVRIALTLKGVPFEQTSYKLRAGEQRSKLFLKLNPQGLVPALEIDGLVLTQSLAICEYLDETRSQTPLLGENPVMRARIRAFAMAIACDIHPVQNLKILQKIQSMGHDEEVSNEWARSVNHEGLAACSALLDGSNEMFCFGSLPTLADICLIPQMANAKRFGVEMIWPRLNEIEARCLSLSAFFETAPDRQPDFVI